MEFSLLKTYAECLKVLNRKDEYVRLVLSLLSKAADAARSRLQHETSYKKSPFYRHTSSWINDAVVDVRGFFSDLVLYSEELPYDVSVPMSRYFDDIQVDHRIGLFEDRDGFQLSLSIRQLLADTLSIGVARVRLVHLGDGQSREIWLQSDKSVELGPSVSQILLTSNVSLSLPLGTVTNITRLQFSVASLWIKSHSKQAELCLYMKLWLNTMQIHH